MSTAPTYMENDSDLIATLLEALRGDSGLQTMLGSPARVFDDETRAPLFPYIMLERWERQDASTSGVNGADHRLQFATLSRDGGHSAAKELLAALRMALQRVELILDNQHVVLVHPTYSDVMRAPNRQVFRGVMRVRIITEEI
ncbi:MAG: DUF3168 domain-containing protein [Hyphomonas sp.]|nr:DUF3168 domain-containing protein [Hyphomonas sp.]